MLSIEILHFIEGNFLITGITLSKKKYFFPFCVVGITDYKIEVYCATDFL